MSTSKGTNEFKNLLNIITSEGSKILHNIDSRGLTLPSLSDPFDPEKASALGDEDSKLSVDLLIAAASNLIAAVQDPRVAMTAKSQSAYIPGSLRAMVELNIPEMLDEAGPDGMHCNEIGKKTNVDPGRIARSLRLLSTDHIFQEVKPNVFAHNRRSSVLSTSKSFAEVSANPETKHDGSTGVPALLSVLAERAILLPTRMLEYLTSPTTASSQEQEASTFALIHGAPFFDWMNLQENAQARKTFAIAMSGTVGFQPRTPVEKAFDWASLPDDGIVVDVGGGVGSATLEIAKAFPKLRYIVQDIPGVTLEGEKWFKAHLPQAVDGGRVKFEGHNFFHPQPPRPTPPSVYFLRLVAHNWSDKYLSILLRNLRDASGPGTHLLIQDSVLLNACRLPEALGKDSLPEIRGVPILDPPSPLLPNLGVLTPYQSDLSMMNILNAQERTLLEFKSVLERSGWKIKYVYRFARVGPALVVSTPV